MLPFILLFTSNIKCESCEQDKSKFSWIRKYPLAITIGER